MRAILLVSTLLVFVQVSAEDWLPLPDNYVWPKQDESAPIFKSKWLEFETLAPRLQSAVKACWPDDQLPDKVEIAEADLNFDGSTEIFVGVPAYSGSGGTGYSIVKEEANKCREIGSLLGFGIRFLPSKNGWLQIEGRSNGGGGQHTRYLLSFEQTEYSFARIENHDLVDREVTIRHPNRAQQDESLKP